MSLNFVAIDFETANYDRDSACSIGLVKVESGKIVSRECRLINPETWFSNFNIGVHGIVPEDVEDAPLFSEVWRELRPLLDGADFIAAHNAPFDKSVLHGCCTKYAMKEPEQSFICTVQLARHVWGMQHAGLDEVCDYLDIELNHHEALSDALACAQIVLKAAEKGHKF